jgi:acylphosphatase
MKRTIHANVSGRVQGVWYRAWMVEEARSLGVDGWVRNLGDGSVEALISGPRENVDALLQLMEEGPPAAEVAKISVSESDETVPEGFFQVS